MGLRTLWAWVKPYTRFFLVLTLLFNCIVPFPNYGNFSNSFLLATIDSAASPNSSKNTKRGTNMLGMYAEKIMPFCVCSVLQPEANFTTSSANVFPSSACHCLYNMRSHWRQWVAFFLRKCAACKHCSSGRSARWPRWWWWWSSSWLKHKQANHEQRYLT